MNLRRSESGPVLRILWKSGFFGRIVPAHIPFLLFQLISHCGSGKHIQDRLYMCLMLRTEVNGTCQLSWCSLPGPDVCFCCLVQNFRSWGAAGVAARHLSCLSRPTCFQKHTALETVDLPATTNPRLGKWSHTPCLHSKADPTPVTLQWPSVTSVPLSSL